MIKRSMILLCMAVFFITVHYVKAEEQPCARRIIDVIIAPSQSETIYSQIDEIDLKQNNNTIYKSLDAGKSWHSISYLRDGYRGLVVDPKDSRIIYAGLIFKSIDSGKTWNGVQLAPTVIDPKNTAIMYSLGSWANIRKSTDGGISWTSLKGDWKSCNAIALAPQNPQILYASCQGGASEGIFKSINAGVTWNMVLPAMIIADLAVDPNNSEIVYAGTRFRGVYRSMDGGKQWHAVNNGLPTGKPSMPWHWAHEMERALRNGETVYKPITRLAIDPIRSNTLYVLTESGVFKSTDAGINWRGINKGLRLGAVRALTIDPKNPDIIYIGTSREGIFKSIDGGENWISSNKGISCGPADSNRPIGH